ncbi:protein DpdH [Deinococcus sp. MIMF12]|uniref:Protein DpdH n=1 Tax=Deinococcus rhizophilus TaxID=3049544 RepID=A0ABT7JFY7_9DEIO|nr:protein DpdH [Deinococcus rhizophilus]MDL2343415.1 protein DpdH [Deinococcus rhizophilus]
MSAPQPFREIVCWQPQALEEVLTIVAARPSDAVFLATHRPAQMTRRAGEGDQGEVDYDEQAFRDEFLSPARANLLVPVIGSSGSGKSHLIRWLDTQVERTPDRHVVNVPKHSTNLRDVITLILKELQGEVFDQFRDRLARAADGLTVTQAVWDLRSNLAYLIEHMPPSTEIKRANGTALTAQELDFYRSSLPAFLLEDVVRRALDADTSVLTRLIKEALHGRSEDKDAAFAIQAHDLPLTLRDVAAAGAKVRGLYQQLSTNAGVREAAVAVMNHFLAPALQRLYNLSGDDLMSLMRDVRQSLKRQQKTLILLIEDFALLQGIQRPLLEALIDDDQRDLCDIRVAFAVTTGYFKDMETVRTRLSFVVDLDVKPGSQKKTRDVRETLTGLYLNAARHGDAALQANLHHLRAGATVDSACTDCPYRPVCHSSFGSVALANVKGTVGLYPLNASALDVVNRRHQPVPELVNPRELLRGLRETLGEAQEGLPDFEFPTRRFQQAYLPGVEPLSDADVARLTTIPDAARRKQAEAVARIWGAGQPQYAAPRGIHDALGYPFTGSGEAFVPPEPSPEDIEVQDPDVQPTVTKRTPLQYWAAGEVLPQTSATELRNEVVAAVNDALDFEALNLDLGALKARGLWGSHSNVEFDGQANPTRGTGFKLRLPLPRQDRAQVALALGAYRHFKKHGEWPRDLPDAPWQVAETVDAWAQEVLAVVDPRQPGQTPLPLAADLLYWQGVASGLQKGSDTQKEWLVMMLQPPGQPSLDAPAGWRRQLEQWRTAHDRARDELLVFAGIRKGTGKVAMVDAARVLGSMKRRGRRLGGALPPAAWDPNALGDMTAKLLGSVTSAIMEAAQEAARVTEMLDTHLNQDEDLKVTLEEVNKALQAAAKAGVLVTETRYGMEPNETIKRVTKEFSELPLPSIRRTCERLLNAQTPEDQLDAAAKVPWVDARRARDVLQTINRTLTQSLRKAEQAETIGKLQGDAGSLAREVIGELDEVFHVLQALKREVNS